MDDTPLSVPYLWLPVLTGHVVHANSPHSFLASSFKLLIGPLVLAALWAVVLPDHDNPWARLVWVSNRIPDTPEGFVAYAKSYWVRINFPSF
ncbi:hypothetical protein M408DRAFT_334165 [Serendipita vermifera MAFF 305830]|uniref:Uncharacterized protein n=1 Tax=Serendipita vermifera MAFF 305830 TaxID=933852 RepID=A0A0C3AJ26_SERVB|nr:hypothetical protein M408DRAFT_334165 [Serendipita vermifera MAFF 305830]